MSETGPNSSVQGKAIQAQQAIAEGQPTRLNAGDLARILNVNDDDANRYSIGRILKHAGFEVEDAATGQEALRRIRNIPDLVILDVQLPDIDGFEVCRRIKNDPASKSIPVLHLSAKYVRDSDRMQGIESGADAYLALPVEQPELLSTVRNLIRLRDAQRTISASARRVAELEKELAGLEHLAAGPSTSVTSRSYGVVPLQEGQPELFKELIVACERLLEIALHHSQYRVEPERIETVRALSDRFGLLRAGPRDVIDIYSAALKQKTANSPDSKAKIYIEEGRLLVLELMGHLVSFYRSAACVPVRRGPPGEVK